ncbi:MAG: penicillin-binding protein [Flavobacteriaceae bacterium]|nr:penicillin-binding protein [Flavobacteriaceae bacterium]
MELQKNKIMTRFYVIIFGMVLFSFLLIFKLFYLQLDEGDKYKELANSSIIKNVPLEPSRGNIYSYDNQILATSIPSYEIRWDATIVKNIVYNDNKTPLIDSLSSFLKISKIQVKNKIESARKNNNRYMLVAKNLSYSEYMRIKKFPIFNLNSYKGGFIVEQKLVREQPLGKIAERTIGYEKKGNSGFYFRVGLEGAFSQYLKGEKGYRLKQKIANGQWKPINYINEKEPTEGYDIYSTIDTNIQDISHNSLLSQLEEFEAEHGLAVVMEVASGEIRAIVNLGRTNQGKYYEKLNYAVGESHEPGSTFKLMSMISLLEDNLIDENTRVDTGNGIMEFFGEYKVKDSKKGGYGVISSSKAFEVSSNTGLVKLVYENYKNNPKKYVDRLYNMDLNKLLKLPIKGEGKPKIPYPTDSSWNGLSLPWMAFGYGVSLTPLQILTFYNAVANDGVMVKPKFIKKISNLGNEPTKIFETEILNPSICSKSTLEKVKKMLFNVVDKKWGTAYKIKDKSLKMSGKTGTCQTNYISDDIQYVSSFVGYFPSEAPKYSCIVVIHKPNKNKGYYGSTVAAPVFKRIAKKIYNDTPKIIRMKESDIKSLLFSDKKKIKNPNLF